MKLKRIASLALSSALLLPCLAVFSGCSDAEIVLRVFSWEEYIDEGGRGSLIYDELRLEGDDGNPLESDIVNDDYAEWYENTMGAKLAKSGPSVIDDFCLWYEKTYHKSIRVEYSTFGTNEDMYNKLLLGKEYDLLCPSDYMIMKLAAENRLVPYDDEFFLTEGEGTEHNYYAKYVSPYIEKVFEDGKIEIPVADSAEPETHTWSEYAAGYMWGTTGFMYNPENVDADELAELGWNAFTHEEYKNKITTKDNVRDSYFAALGLTYQDKLLELDKNAEDYKETLTAIFNRTDEEFISDVEQKLMEMKKNVYSFETDTGKKDLVSGKIWLNYAWSGDAVYAMDLAEEDNDTELYYYVPEAGSNLWFDGWVMTKSVEKKEGKKHAAQAFVNFLSMPENAMRNSYYIGYTSVIAGERMLNYVDYLYGYYPEDEEVEEGEELPEPVDYDLTYFFYGADYDGDPLTIPADPDQATGRQLYAQFPPEEVIERCAVMKYFEPETNERINELWSRVKAEKLDAWAIIVICVTVLAIIAFVVYVKFGDKIDFFRAKPKKGYHLVKQEKYKK